jgi:hypothetical protein
MFATARFVAIGLLVSVAAALVVGIIMLQDWGGRIETMLIIYGDRVWLSLDAGRPRILLLLLIPAIFLGAAVSLHAGRRGE